MFDSIDPLSRLRDIHEPASLWPSALAWVVAGIAFGAVFLLMVQRGRARRAADPRRAALRELADMRRRSADDKAARTLVAELAVLLRRFALVRYPGSPVAGLCGCAWLEFLDRKCGSRGFADGAGKCLTAAPYMREPHVDVAPLLALSESFLLSRDAPEIHTRPVWPGVRHRVNRMLERRRMALVRRQLRSACRGNDARAARAALLQWARLVWPGSPPCGLQALAGRVDDEALAAALAELDGSLYAANVQPWRGRAWWRNANTALRQYAREAPSRNALPPLYADPGARR